MASALCVEICDALLVLKASKTGQVFTITTPRCRGTILLLTRDLEAIGIEGETEVRPGSADGCSFKGLLS